jgi:hypothetical protein
LVAGIGVIIPAVTTFENLTRTLKALERERSSFALDAFVVSRQGPSFDQGVRTAFPWVYVLDVPTETPVPLMRLRGLRAVQGDCVAIIEDHVTVPVGWAALLASRVRETGGVVAGPLSNGANESLTSQAAFLCEYAACLPPLPAGEASWLPGNNTGYPTALLLAHADVLEAGGWEDEIHRRIRASGGKLWMEPALESHHHLPITAGQYVADRYWYSRAFSAVRTRGAPFAIKIAYAAGAFLLPPVLLARILSAVLTRRQYLIVAVMSLPLLMLFVVAWAAGELVGYVAGAGRALGKVR